MNVLSFSLRWSTSLWLPTFQLNIKQLFHSGFFSKEKVNHPTEETKEGGKAQLCHLAEIQFKSTKWITTEKLKHSKDEVPKRGRKWKDRFQYIMQKNMSLNSEFALFPAVLDLPKKTRNQNIFDRHIKIHYFKGVVFMPSVFQNIILSKIRFFTSLTLISMW